MLKRLIMMATAAAMFVGAQSVHAQQGEKSCSKGEKSSCCTKKKMDQQQPSIGQIKEITKDDVATLLKNNGAMIVDARDADSYAAGHIDGAVSFASLQLPADKNAALVFYCGGLRCPAAGKAAKKAAEQGYTNVMVYKGGWADWSSNS
ncbi:MAG: rhodanese-like domain-containing protein [Chlorobi bacterium]|nr:MAG: rhodanese domain-containing protein [Chlorobi bacterium OLB7]MBK8910521.1 rhodanese-like domain-containing protein [Chlorobiota bacterium]MBX7216911.1 rhodanese-like domain-containing protein [Candidatus Kapabacteria bacterium]